MEATTTKTPKIYVLHENNEWIEPLKEAFQQQGLPFEFWFINEDCLDLHEEPPDGVFYNRMSASAHTRDHRYAIEVAEPIIAWLERHGRRVINGRQALNLEVRKAEQYLGLQPFGITIPHTVVVNNDQDLVQKSEQFPHSPFLVKPNRGGKGAGVQMFDSAEDLKAQIEKGTTQFESLDGILLLQQYVRPANGHIVRLEFIGGKFFYAVQVDATGGFELCPADQCETNDQAGDEFCPADNTNGGFQILKGYEDSAIPIYEQFLAEHGIEIGAIEYVENEAGKRFVYDININTNYNSAAQQAAGKSYNGMGRIAELLGAELETVGAVAKSYP